MQNTEEQKSSGQMSLSSALPCFNLFKAAETVAAENERPSPSQELQGLPEPVPIGVRN